jgi:hypothetical protein
MISALHDTQPPVSAPAPAPLRVLSLDDAKIGLDDVVVRPRHPGQLVIIAVLLALAAWTAWKAAGGFYLPLAALGIVTLLTISWLLYRQWRRAARPGAWLMAIGRERVLIRYRGVMNIAIPASDPQVIELPLAYVRSVRRLKRSVRGAAGKTGLTYEYLDFRVQGCDLRPLQVMLMEEHRDRSEEWFARRDPAVIVTGDGVLRVETSFQGSGVSPRTDELLRQLAERVPLDAEEVENIDVQEPTRMMFDKRAAALRAIGETNPGRAVIIARKMQPDATEAELQAHVMGLIACPAPTAAPAATKQPATDGAAAPELAGDGIAAPVEPVEPALQATPEKAALPAPRILRPAEVELRPDERQVRSRATGWLLSGIFCIGLTGWLAWRGWTGMMHWGWAAALGAASLVLCWGFVEGWYVSLQPGAWQLAIGPERILVPLRPYTHEHLKVDDRQILELPLAHLVSVRGTKLKRMRARGGSRPDYTHFHCVDFQTRGMDLGPLQEVLAAEGSLNPDGSRGNATVQIADGEVVRVSTKSNWSRTEEMLRMVGERVPAEEDVLEEVDVQGRIHHTLLNPTPTARKQASGQGSP